MTQQTNTDPNDWLDEILEDINIAIIEGEGVDPKSYFGIDTEEIKQAILAKVDEMVREARADELRAITGMDLWTNADGTGGEYDVSKKYVDERLKELLTNKKGGE